MTKKARPNLYDTALQASEEGSFLNVNSNQKTGAATEANSPPNREVRSKTLKAVPAEWFALHETLRRTNKTNLDFSNWIMEAMREKFERYGIL